MGLADYGRKYGFAVVFGEATQNIFGNGGEWNIPEIQTDATGPKCAASDSVEVVIVDRLFS